MDLKAGRGVRSSLTVTGSSRGDRGGLLIVGKCHRSGLWWGWAVMDWLPMAEAKTAIETAPYGRVVMSRVSAKGECLGSRKMGRETAVTGGMEERRGFW